MTVNTSLSPMARGTFAYHQAQHLLNRAGFGGTPQQIQSLQSMGLDKAVDLLVNYQAVDIADLPAAKFDPDIIRPPTPEERQAEAAARKAMDEKAIADLRAKRNMRQGEDRGQMRAIEKWWLNRMIATPRPLEEKLTLLWHGHFATNQKTVKDSYLMWKQNDFFRRNALSFADLARGLIHDPAMIRFLDNNTNRRQHPNENLAREIMELFTLGQGHYGESDIKEGARALTGYSFFDNDFVLQIGQHDAAMKTILGQTGRFNGEDFVAILLGRADCPRFVAYKLYKHFVGDLGEYRDLDEPAATVVSALAGGIVKHNYALGPVLAALFKSQHFYDPAVIGNMIKSPAQLVVGTMRLLNTPERDVSVLIEAMNQMGQKLFDPPSVAGWPGGRSWINTSTLYARQNLCAYMISGKMPFRDNWNKNRIGYDPMFLIAPGSAPGPAPAASRSPQAVVDQVAPALLGENALPARRKEFATFLEQRGGGHGGAVVDAEGVLALLLLITATPEYQLC